MDQFHAIVTADGFYQFDDFSHGIGGPCLQLTGGPLPASVKLFLCH
jgi:hypothetical protein